MVIHLNDDHVMVCLPLLERAGQAQFLLPGLSQPVAWAMARTVEPTAGEVVLDAMCGSGIVLLEVQGSKSKAFPAFLGLPGGAVLARRLLPGRRPRYQAAGEHLGLAELCGQERSAANLKSVPALASSVSFLRGDARHLPLGRSSVDAVLCDLPFGKRYGTVEENGTLYPLVVKEFRRVLRPGGRVVLLTSQANASTLRQALEDWRVDCERKVLLGHMEAGLEGSKARR